MKPHSFGRVWRSDGFTLVELIIVIVILAIAATGIASLQGRIFSGQSSVKDLQVLTRIMEECAEQVLAVRQHTLDGYEQVNTTANPRRFDNQRCDTITALAGYDVPTVSVIAYNGTLCPTNKCKTVTISQGGVASLTLLLMDY